MALGRHRQISLTVISVATLWLAGACGQSSAETPGPAKIMIKDFTFVPMSMTVNAGSTVTWTNMDDEAHNLVSDTGLFRSGAMDTNETFSFKFDKPGTYHITCSIHPRMVATIVVE